MISLQLVRDYFTSYCTLGTLLEPASGRVWQTIERPWVPSSYTLAGVKGQSCVGLGTYRLQRYTSDAHPGVFALSSPQLDVYETEAQVPQFKAKYARTRVLIHPANWASELRGCVAPGKTRARGRDGLYMITASRDAMNEIRNVLGRYADLSLSISSTGGLSS